MVIPKYYRRIKREALEDWLWGTATVYGDVEVTDPYTNLSTFENKELFYEIPCRIQNQSSQITTDNEPATLSKSINLRFEPEINLQAGSTFVITYMGYTATYKRSGEARHYPDHQVIPVIQEAYA